MSSQREWPTPPEVAEHEDKPLEPWQLAGLLSQVLAYRDLCRAMRRSGRENFFFAALMAFFAHLSWQNGAANGFFVLVYLFFVVAELGIALYKWLWPSAEGMLGDVLIMLAFAGLNGLLAYVQLQAGVGPNPVLAFLTGLALLASWRQWQAYRQWRRLFRIRPSRRQLRAFEQFVQDIVRADPHTDHSVIDLPTRPPLKAVVLGDLVAAVETQTRNVLLADPLDFSLAPVPDDTGEKRDWVSLTFGGKEYPPFPIDPASWSNYQRWRRQMGLEGSPSH